MVPTPPDPARFQMPQSQCGCGVFLLREQARRGPPQCSVQKRQNRGRPKQKARSNLFCGGFIGQVGKLGSLGLGCPAQSHSEHLVLLMTPSPVPGLGAPASPENPPLGALVGWGAHQPP